MIREQIATAVLQTARSFGRILGCELAVETSQHSLKTSMVVPDRNDRAWDPGLYKYGNLFHEGYANPIKPRARRNTELEDPDTIDVETSDATADVEAAADDEELDKSDDTDVEHVKLISSPRYRKYMRQDLISQLLTPKEQWRLIAYGVLGLAGVQVVTLLVILWANGSF
jgi:hypothetical protein